MGQESLFSRLYNRPNTENTRVSTPEEIAANDIAAKEAIAKGPIWKRYATQAIESGVDGLMGFLGIPQNESKSSQTGELVNAGMPFASYAALKGIGKLFHGTPKLRELEKFNPNLYNKGDVLGWMTHAAENPDYAASYAQKMGQNAGKSMSGQSINPGMIPLQPEANNVLDLVDPNADEISQALAFTDEFTKKSSIKQFKEVRKNIRRGIHQDYEDNFQHRYHNQAPIDEHPIRAVAENLRLKPEVTENMPWDAIRYLDVNEKSWAFPKNTPLRSVYGAKLNDAAEGITSPIKLVRDDNVVQSGKNLPALTQPTGLEWDNWAYDAKNKPIKNQLNDFIDSAVDSPYKIGDTVNVAYKNSGSYPYKIENPDDLAYINSYYTSDKDYKITKVNSGPAEFNIGDEVTITSFVDNHETPIKMKISDSYDLEHLTSKINNGDWKFPQTKIDSDTGAGIPKGPNSTVKLSPQEWLEETGSMANYPDAKFLSMADKKKYYSLDNLKIGDTITNGKYKVTMKTQDEVDNAIKSVSINTNPYWIENTKPSIGTQLKNKQKELDTTSVIAKMKSNLLKAGMSEEVADLIIQAAKAQK